MGRCGLQQMPMVQSVSLYFLICISCYFFFVIILKRSRNTDCYITGTFISSISHKTCLICSVVMFVLHKRIKGSSSLQAAALQKKTCNTTERLVLQIHKYKRQQRSTAHRLYRSINHALIKNISCQVSDFGGKFILVHQRCICPTSKLSISRFNNVRRMK